MFGVQKKLGENVQGKTKENKYMWKKNVKFNVKFSPVWLRDLQEEKKAGKISQYWERGETICNIEIEERLMFCNIEKKEKRCSVILRERDVCNIEREKGERVRKRKERVTERGERDVM